MLRKLREARDRLTDAEAHELLADRGAGQRRRQPGRAVGEAFLEVRELLARSRQLGIVVRDIDRGLIDFPAIRDGREVYLCWELDEERIGFWHDLESGYGGRQPLAGRARAERSPGPSASSAPARSRSSRACCCPGTGSRSATGSAVTGLDSFGFAHAALLLTVAAAVVVAAREARGERCRARCAPPSWWRSPAPGRRCWPIYLIVDRPDELAGTPGSVCASGSSSPSAAASRSSSAACGCARTGT